MNPMEYIEFTDEVCLHLADLLTHGDLEFARGLSLIEVNPEIRKLGKIPLPENPWPMLEKMGVPLELLVKIKEVGKYHCYMIEENRYYGTWPIVVATTNAKNMKEKYLISFSIPNGTNNEVMKFLHPIIFKEHIWGMATHLRHYQVMVRVH
jgi:hypothetical protein